MYKSSLCGDNTSNCSTHKYMCTWILYCRYQSLSKQRLVKGLHNLYHGWSGSMHQHSASFTYGLSIFHTSTFHIIYLQVLYFPHITIQQHVLTSCQFPHINILHHLLTGCLFSTHQHSPSFTYGLSIFHTYTFPIIYLRVVYFPWGVDIIVNKICEV